MCKQTSFLRSSICRKKNSTMEKVNVWYILDHSPKNINFTKIQIQYCSKSRISAIVLQNSPSYNRTGNENLRTRGKQKHPANRNTGIGQVVLKDVGDLDVRLKIFMYSTQNNLNNLNGVKHKRDRKPETSGTF